MSLDPNAARILIVDDDPGILRAVSRVLGRRHRVSTASTGAEALDEAARQRPDLAIVDIRLPEMTGFEVTRALKSTLPDVDVILMTGNAEEPDENLIRAIDEGAFYFVQKPFDRRVLLTLVGRCLELRLLRGERERYLRRVARELDEARRFQQSLLPPPLLEREGLAIAARYLACSELAGDIYDYVEAGDGSVALLIADVVGHGASAAMMTGLVKAAFRASHVDGFEPSSVIDRVREGLRDFEPSRFVTLCTARVDASRRGLAYINAGHPEPAVRGGSGMVRLLDATGPLLSSALLDLPCEQVTLALSPGDSLLFYTDGITEARGPGGMFGQGRLVEALMRGDRRGPELLDGLLAELVAFSGSASHQDDITILTLDLSGA
ncbi:PP2C family protein-serine/threonine phosphatase [Tautonia plasticadhaerens]|uniref:Phosphoserine phosphatase RsbP n=1 Tax=Tautonia plasticadhaerens TaxID=2527974 RepID=A0A518H4I5_9BACT|nr:SpoIIE family protein phosphatase [Tautonia plasticadhaerens]QDV35743.1 Phosphoserine phosphatase RsbP [Tautonia plasticadhaerens]